MKTFKNENFNVNDFNSCVNRGMDLIRNHEEHMIDEGYEWPINTDSCKHSIEQAIINRENGETMMGAVIGYVDRVAANALSFNGIELVIS